MVSQITRILFPTDLSSASRHAFDYAISQATQERKCDFVVMGHHPRGQIGEAFLGSTTRRVLRRSKIPVLLVRLPDKKG